MNNRPSIDSTHRLLVVIAAKDTIKYIQLTYDITDIRRLIARNEVIVKVDHHQPSFGTLFSHTMRQIQYDVYI